MRTYLHAPIRLTSGRLRQALIIVLVACVGYGVLTITHAATGSTVVIGVASGKLSGGASIVAAAGASAGKAVRFEAAAAITSLPAQSASIMYYGDTSQAVTYEHPGALVVTGRANYQDTTFKAISAAGGTVLIYLDPLINEVDGTYDSMLINSSTCGPAVPLWPGSPDANSSGYLLDFRTGGIEQQKLKCVLERMVADNPHIGGFFADDVGSRSWYPNFDWNTWGATNQQAYRDGAIALMETFRQVANEHHLIVIVNGTWGAGTLAADGGGYPDMNQSGNALADGGVVEHHDASELSYWTSYACSSQWASQSPITNGVAINWAIETTDSDRAAYAATNCFAYVNNQPSANYDYAPPWGPFHPTGLPSHVTQ